MKLVSSAMRTLLGLGGQTLVRCWQITTRDGMSLGFTKHTRKLTLDGFVYTPLGGIRDSAIESAMGLQVDNQELTLFVSQLEKSDVVKGRYDGARIRVFDVDYQNLSAGIIPHKVGILGNITMGEGIATAELRGPAQILQTKILDVFTSTCPVRLGSPRCKVELYNRILSEVLIFNAGLQTLQIADADLAQLGFKVGDTLEAIDTVSNDGFYSVLGIVDDTMTLDPAPAANETVNALLKRYSGFSFVGTVTAVDTTSPRRIFTIDLTGSLPPGTEIAVDDFQEGEVLFSSGANVGLASKSVRSHIGLQLTLYDEFPADIAVNDMLLITKGCNKLKETCIAKFDNYVNFQGFPDVPVPEEVFDTPVTVS